MKHKFKLKYNAPYDIDIKLDGHDLKEHGIVSIHLDIVADRYPKLIIKFDPECLDIELKDEFDIFMKDINEEEKANDLKIIDLLNKAVGLVNHSDLKKGLTVFRIQNMIKSAIGQIKGDK